MTGCTRLIDEPRPQAAPDISPITAGEVHELLSPNAGVGDGNLFVRVAPEECSGVAREVDPPFLADRDPAATDGGHWADGGVMIEEMVAVYESDFDPQAALAAARSTLDACSSLPFTVSTMAGRDYTFRLLPPVDAGSPDIVAWSFRADDWACDNVYVAAHNAAAEIAACSALGGFNVLVLADAALDRIEALANTTA